MGEWSLDMLRKCVVLTLAFLLGCVSAPTESNVMEPSVPVLWRVQIEDEANNEAVVHLVGIHELDYSTFRMDDPRKVVLEYDGAVGTNFVPPSPQEGSLVDQVSVSELGDASNPVTRIEFGLTAAAVFEVIEDASEFSFRVISISDSMVSETGLPGSSLAVESAELDEEPAPQAPVMVLAPAAQDATALTGVEAQAVEGGFLVHMNANGSIRSSESFVLENPSRLVIDLPGLKSEMDSAKVGFDSEFLARARVGKHADKVRIVFDGKSGVEDFDGRWVVPTRDGLLVTFGTTAAVQAALDAALAPVYVEATPEEDAQLALADEAAAESEEALEEPIELAVLEGVEFTNENGLDRVVLSSDRPVVYNTFEPDPNTLIVRIENAELSAENEVRLVSEGQGPVSSVTAFQQPEAAVPEVRLVLTRKAGEQPVITRDGTDIVVDFVYEPMNEAVNEATEVAEVTEADDATPVEATPTADEAIETAAAAVVAEDALAEAEVAAADAPEVAPAEEVSEETVAEVAETDVAPEAAPIDVAETAETKAADKALAAAGAEAAAPPAALEGTVESTEGIDVLKESGFHEGKRYTGELISLDFHQADMSNILRLIAEVSGLNVIAGDAVRGKITIRLRDVPWDQALDIILMTQGLGFYRMGDVLRIAPADVLRREEEARLQERRAKEKLEDLVVRLVPVNYASVGEVRGLVRDVLTARGTVMVDTRTNTLILKDIEKVLDEAEALVRTLDTATPQVLIESKIVEASLDFSRQLGTEWEVYKNANPDGHIDVNDDFVFRDNTTGDQGDASTFPNNAIVSNAISADPTGAISLGFLLLDQHFGVNMAIEAAESENMAKVISSPRVVTLDNRTAKIEQGVALPYQTRDNGEASLEFVDAVLSLEVTPHITSNRSVIMKVKVTKDAPNDAFQGQHGEASISKNHVETEALVRDGQTLVLGGIYQVDTGNKQSRVPFLHQVPILGALFKKDEDRRKQTELLIFISPSVADWTPVAAR